MASKGKWKKIIIAACEEAGTYQPCFDSVIETLAAIMENRDKAQKQFKESGSLPVIEHVNKAGFSNMVKNPALVVVNECNTLALAHWRDLGLTPSSFKKLDGTIKKKEDSFDELVNKLGI